MPEYVPVYRNDITAVSPSSQRSLIGTSIWPGAGGLYVVGTTTMVNRFPAITETTLRFFSQDNDFLHIMTVPGVPVIERRPGGGAVVAWSTNEIRTLTQGDIFVQWFDADGVATGPAQRVNATPDSASNVVDVQPSVVALSSGNTLVFWTNDTGSNATTRYQIFDANHVKVGGERAFLGAVRGEAVELADGSFIMMSDYAAIQRFSATGEPLSGGQTLSNASRSELVEFESGEFAVIWRNGQTVEAQYFTAQGIKSGGVLQLKTFPADVQPGWSVSSVGADQIVMSWYDGAGTGATIFERNGQVVDTIEGEPFGGGLALGFADGSIQFLFSALGNAGSIIRGIRYAPDTLMGDTRIGTALDDRMFASDSGVLMEGRAGTDTLIGGAGNDTLDGGSGNDSMAGGLGDDRYIVDQSGDTVTELADQGFDTVVASLSYALAADTSIERLMTTDDATTYPINLTGNNLANEVRGNAAANILDGAGGDDVLYGLAGNDILIGGAGNDTMYGGLGDDVYFVSDAGDQVIEAIGEGMDMVRASVNYVLTAGSSVEILSSADVTFPYAISLTGNERDNTIWGDSGANTLSGAAGSDYLDGFAGNDTLDGGTGDDVMVGGLGDDTYIVDSLLDRPIETVGQGYDTVRSSISYSLLAGSELEKLTTTNAQGTAAINLTGNGLANVIEGSAGANILDGGAGNDVLDGFGGDDILIGGLGADTMRGGAGNDSYFGDDASDVIVEAADSGTDIVRSSVNYALTPGAHVEILSAADVGATTALNLSGNELANSLWGNAGANILDGGAGNDYLDGFGGNDVLIGGAGADTMVGWSGDDTFYVDNQNDRVIEFANEGYDVVRASVDFVLTAASHIELLVAADVGSISTLHLTGNELGQAVLGNNGFNILAGGGGDDLLNGYAGLNTLIGGTGADSFAFTTRLSDQSTTISDFNVADDTILLGAAADQTFAGMTLGVLAASAFLIGTAATTAEHRIIYNSANGGLYYDADGTGAGAAQQIAQLQIGLAMTNADFVVTNTLASAPLLSGAAVGDAAALVLPI